MFFRIDKAGQNPNLARPFFLFCALAAVHCLFPSRLLHANLTLRMDPPYISPNGDGLQDEAFFYPVLQRTSGGIQRWQLDIFSSNRKRLIRLSGKGLPGLIKWDAHDKKGALVPEGKYEASLRVWAGGETFSTRAEFFVDTQAPDNQLALSAGVLDKKSFETETVILKPSYADPSPLGRWQMQILDVRGRTVFVFWSTGTLQNVTWGGIDQETGVFVPQGQYRCVFQSWDMAGNEGAPSFVDLAVNVTPRDLLEETLKKIHVQETDIGLIVQLSVSNLFEKKKGRPQVSEAGKTLLKEAAFLINAYPDVPVRLDGYSKKHKKAQQNRDQSSVYAWSVYSQLVKNENVEASRLSVKGRGVEIDELRQTADLPLVKEGVEIILEGNRNW